MATTTSSTALPAQDNTSTTLPPDLTLLISKHVSYIQSLDTQTNKLSYWLTEHLRLNGLYWGLCAVHLLGHADALPRQGVLDFVFACWNTDGGFGAAPGHDSHMLYSVSAVQILALVDGVGELEERREGGRMVVGKCESYSCCFFVSSSVQD